METNGSRRRRLSAGSYERVLVPVDSRSESFQALDLACRLAADSHAKISAIVVLEVPALLPLDAHLRDEEEDARQILDRARAIANSYGIKLSATAVRARDSGAAIVRQAASEGVELVVIAAPRTELERSGRRTGPDVVSHVLKDAPCRVMVVSAARSRSAA
jgi:nucleotide-binding universal stress UspA family protein